MEKRQFKQLYIFNIIVLLCAYSSMLFMHFSIDSYGLYFGIDEDTALKAGRLLFYLFYLLCERINFNPVKCQIFLIILFITFSAYVLTSLVRAFAMYFEKRSNIVFLSLECGILLGFVNVFYFEWFLYPEMTLIYGVSMLFLLLAFKTIQRENFGALFISSSLLFLGLNCYQAIFPIYIILTVTSVLLNHNLIFSKDTAKAVGKIILAAGIAAILQLLELRVLQSFGYVRGDFIGDSENTIVPNIVEIIREQIPLWYSAFGFLPKMVVVVFMCIVLTFIIVQLVGSSLKIRDIIFDGLMLLGCYASIFILGIFNSTIWLAPRTIPGFFFFLSMLLLISLALNKLSPQGEKFFFGVIIVFLLVNFIQIQDIARNHYMSLVLNEQQAICVEEQIKNYEEKSGAKINNIAVRNDKNPTWGYKNIKYNRFDTNMRAFIVSWTAVPCLNYYTGNSYKQVEFPDEIYYKFGENCDWDELNLSEQMVFINDTAYLVNY